LRIYEFIIQHLTFKIAMSWYIAKVVFQIVGEGMTKPQFDEHLRLVQADGFEEALLKARILGLHEEEIVINHEHGPFRWECVNVAELTPLKEIKDGIELYSQVREMDEASSYINYVHNCAAFMQLNYKPAF
jgi:hypothetical protein